MTPQEWKKQVAARIASIEVAERHLAVLRTIGADCQQGTFGANLAERLWDVADGIHASLASSSLIQAPETTTDEKKDFSAGQADDAQTLRNMAQSTSIRVMTPARVAALEAGAAALRRQGTCATCQHGSLGDPVLCDQPDMVLAGHSSVYYYPPSPTFGCTFYRPSPSEQAGPR